MQLTTTMRDENGSLGLIHLCQDIKQYLQKEKFDLVEIGSYAGESAVIFAEQFPNATIYCIDPWLGGYDNQDSASFADYSQVEKEFDFRTSKFSNIQKLKGYSTDFEIKYDVIYIDGRHFYEGVKEDLLHWIPLRKQKAIISGHDYYQDKNILKIHPHIEGVRKAIDEILLSPLKTYQDSSWMIQLL